MFTLQVDSVTGLISLVLVQLGLLSRIASILEHRYYCRGPVALERALNLARSATPTELRMVRSKLRIVCGFCI